MMVHPKRVRHVLHVVGQQCRGLRTSRKGGSQQGMAVSTEHDDEVVAESEAQAHPQQ